MASLVRGDHWKDMFMQYDHPDFYPAFLNHITRKFRGIENRTITSGWEFNFYNAIRQYECGEAPGIHLSAALGNWRMTNAGVTDFFLSRGPITENTQKAIENQEKQLKRSLWSNGVGKEGKMSKGQRKKANVPYKRLAAGVGRMEIKKGEIVDEKVIGEKEEEEEFGEEEIEAEKFAQEMSIPIR